MTERLQVAEMRFLRRVDDATLHDEVRSCEIRKTLNVEPLLRKADPSYVDSAI